MRQHDYCQTCGSKLNPLAKVHNGYSCTSIVVVKEHRPVNSRPAPGVTLESSPQLTVSMHVCRNGGTEDRLCAECIKVAARALRKQLDLILTP
jgi:hypothetical protein